MASLEPPFQEDTIQGLFKSILYKNPKPLQAYYSSKLSEFIFRMLEKKKNARPLITDLINFFSQPIAGCNFNLHSNPADYENYVNYC
jgi:hypothetical protein